MLEELIKFKLLFVIAVLFNIVPSSFGDKGTFVDEINFIQYLDENTALQEVRNGNLDLYYFRVPSDRLEDFESRENLQVFESTGSYYSILTNPTDSGKFNPFSIKEVRFALNYLIDRNLIVNELLGGFGSPMTSNYGVFSADYLGILDVTESFQFRYNPILAEQIISEETGVANSVDPLAGSYLVEEMTSRIVSEAKALIEQIDSQGGGLECIKSGLQQRMIHDSAWKNLQEIESGEIGVVGVNSYLEDNEYSINTQKFDSGGFQARLDALTEYRDNRNQKSVNTALELLENACTGEDNVMEPMIESVKAGAKIGEVNGVLKSAFGTWISPSGV